MLFTQAVVGAAADRRKLPVMPASSVITGVWVCANRHVQERLEHPRSMPCACHLPFCGVRVRRLSAAEHAAYLIGGGEAVLVIMPPLMMPGVLHQP